MDFDSWANELVNEHNKEKEDNSLKFEQVTEYINSSRFVSLLSNYDYASENEFKKITGMLIGVAFDYADIFSRSGTSTIEEMEKILKGVLKREMTKQEYNLEEVFKNKLLKDLGIDPKGELSESEEMLAKETALEYLEFKITKFHAFNGSFLDSIKENGINPNKKSNEKEKEIMDGIFNKYGVSWKSSMEADKGYVSFSRTASVSYDYALTSPEWFGRMCGLNNYSTRNYEACKQNFLRVARDYNISEEDKNVLIECFESCWKSFCGNKTYLAIVNADCDYKEEHKQKLRDMLDGDGFDKTFKVFNGIRSNESNARSSETIDTKNAVFVELPDLKELQKKIEAEKQANQGLAFDA